MKKKRINSHIGIPKFLIKRFADKDEHVFEYAIEAGTTSKKSPKSIGTSLDYYDEKTEGSLSREIEVEFSNFLREIDKRDTLEEKNFVLSTHGEIVQKFLITQLLRSPVVHLKVMDDLQEETGSYELTPSKIMGEFVKRFEESPNDFLFDDMTSFCALSPKGDLITNSMGFYFVYANDVPTCAVIPVSPKGAIVTMKKEDFVAKEMPWDRLNLYCKTMEIVSGQGILLASKRLNFGNCKNLKKRRMIADAAMNSEFSSAFKNDQAKIKEFMKKIVETLLAKCPEDDKGTNDSI